MSCPPYRAKQHPKPRRSWRVLRLPPPLPVGATPEGLVPRPPRRMPRPWTETAVPELRAATAAFQRVTAEARRLRLEAEALARGVGRDA